MDFSSEVQHWPTWPVYLLIQCHWWQSSHQLGQKRKKLGERACTRTFVSFFNSVAVTEFSVCGPSGLSLLLQWENMFDCRTCTGYYKLQHHQSQMQTDGWMTWPRAPDETKDFQDCACATQFWLIPYTTLLTGHSFGRALDGFEPWLCSKAILQPRGGAHWLFKKVRLNVKFNYVQT